MKTIYQVLRDAGIELDNHCSSLYVLNTPEARALIEGHGNARGCPYRCDCFTGTDGRRWLELFGCYDPFWSAQ